MTKYNSRKFILTIVGLVNINLLLLLSKINSAQFVALFLPVIGAYTIANLYQKDEDGTTDAGGTPD